MRQSRLPPALPSPDAQLSLLHRERPTDRKLATVASLSVFSQSDRRLSPSIRQIGGPLSVVSHLQSTVEDALHRLSTSVHRRFLPATLLSPSAKIHSQSRNTTLSVVSDEAFSTSLGHGTCFCFGDWRE